MEGAGCSEGRTGAASAEKSSGLLQKMINSKTKIFFKNLNCDNICEPIASIVPVVHYFLLLKKKDQCLYRSNASSRAFHWFSMEALIMPVSVSIMQPPGETSDRSWIERT